MVRACIRAWNAIKVGYAHEAQETMQIGLSFPPRKSLSRGLLVAVVLTTVACQDSGGDGRPAADAAVAGRGGSGGHVGGPGSGGTKSAGGSGGAATEIVGGSPSGGSSGAGGTASGVATGGTATSDAGATNDSSGKSSSGGSSGGGFGGSSVGGMGGSAAGIGGAWSDAGAGGSASGGARSDAAADGPASDSGTASCYQEALGAITLDSLKTDITTLASRDFEGRKTGTAGERKAVDYIVGQFKAAGLDGVAGKYEQAFSVAGVSGTNTVAVLSGTDPILKDEVIVVGAHHDHLGKTATSYYPGADDNASGSSAVMALGRAFAKCKGQVKRTIVFMTYGGEEEGVYGSIYYTTYPLYPIAKTMYMVNHDMIGYVAKNKLEVSWGTAFARATLTAACNRVSFCTLIQSDMKNEQGTDSDTFAAVKVPYTGFFSGYHDCYHKTCDTADKLDMAGVTDTARLSFDLVYALASTGQSLVKSAAYESGMVLDRSRRAFRDHGIAPAAK
jgi:hypothetical protein